MWTPGPVAAQTAAAAQATDASPSAPIYWRQNLLTVPYQLNANAAGGAPKSVWLYVSKDRGINWQPISDAQPQLLAFNYRAESDGEYWFAIRTTDASGRAAMSNGAAPGQAMQPELRVIVDTNLPRFESLTCQWQGASKLDVRWRVVDVNLAPHACNLEYQVADSTTWQPVPLASATETILGTWDGLATIAITAESRPTAVRATVTDLAGNRAVYQTPVAPSADSIAGGPQLSSVENVAAANSPFSEGQGWMSSSAPSLAPAAQVAEPQLWPADRDHGPALTAAAKPPAAINYGVPVGLEAPESNNVADDAEQNLDIPEPTTEDRPLGLIPPQRSVVPKIDSPFRPASMSQPSPTNATDPPRVDTPPRDNIDVPPPPANPLARLVNSRTFSLEYELAEVGRGISKVELWGTHDGGATWRLFAVDNDNRSPLQVTVDGAGEYGFSIVVETIDGSSNSPPHQGDTPELWINVDLQPPQAQILSVNSARNAIGGDLMMTWEADDDNLESRPVSLFYSSRPAGPWTTIATNLAGTGHLDWPIARHIPRRLYLKLEARDTAGNVAVYQTGEPVMIESEQAVARVQRLPPVD